MGNWPVIRRRVRGIRFDYFRWSGVSIAVPPFRPVLLTLAAAAIAGTALPHAVEAEEVLFSRDIAPVLVQKCVTCHGPDKEKGGYRVDTFSALNRAGDSGEEPLIAGKPDQSLLFQLLLEPDEDNRMPQKDDPLPMDVVEKFRSWIGQGCRFDGADPDQPLSGLIAPAAHPAPPELYPHAIPLLSVAWMKDGRRYAVGGQHEVIVRELDNGSLVQRLTNLPERIHALLPLGDDRLIYAGGAPGRAGELGIIDLNADAGSVGPRVLARSHDTFLTVAVAPGNELLAVGGADKWIRLIEIVSGRELRQLTHHADWVLGLAFNADGSRLASASRDGTARVFDPANGEMLAAFRGHEGAVFDVAWLGDQSMAASGGRDGKVRFWKAVGATQTGDVGGLGGEVFKLRPIEGGLLAVCADGGVRQLNAERKIVASWLPKLDAASAVGFHAGTGLWMSGHLSGAVAVGRIGEAEMRTNCPTLPLP